MYSFVVSGKGHSCHICYICLQNRNRESLLAVIMIVGRGVCVECVVVLSPPHRTVVVQLLHCEWLVVVCRRGRRWLNCLGKSRALSDSSSSASSWLLLSLPADCTVKLNHVACVIGLCLLLSASQLLSLLMISLRDGFTVVCMYFCIPVNVHNTSGCNCGISLITGNECLNHFLVF